MKLFLLIACLLVFAPYARAENSIKIEVKARVKDHYSLISNQLARGQSSDVISTVQIAGSGIFSDINMTVGPNHSREVLSADLLEIGKESLKIEDRGNNVVRTVKANVSRSLFRQRIKGLTVPAEEMKLVIKDQLSKLGRQMLDSLPVGKGLIVQTSLESSDYVCLANEESQLDCELEAQMVISTSGK